MSESIRNAFEKWARNAWSETPEDIERSLRRGRMGLVYEDPETHNAYIAWLAGFNHCRKWQTPGPLTGRNHRTLRHDSKR